MNRKTVKWFINVAVTLWIAIYTFPIILYGSPFKTGRYQIYGIVDSEKAALDRIVAKADHLLLNHLGNLPSSVTLVFPAEGTYRLFNPLSINAYASTNVANVIWFNRSDLSNDRTVSNVKPFYSRTVSGVLAHEVMHVAIRESFGISSRWKIPGWIQEGYCDFIARETSIPFLQGVRQVEEGSTDESKSFSYFKSYLTVRGFIEIDKKTFSQLMQSDEIHRSNPDALLQRFLPQIQATFKAHHGSLP